MSDDKGPHLIDLSDPAAPPGFRVTAAELSNDAAFDAMEAAARAMTDASLAARYSLLTLGFSSTHSFCVELDRTATQYAVALDAPLHQRRPPEDPT